MIPAVSNEIVLVEKRQNPIDSRDWHKTPLRQCLHALGFTDAEIRHRKGLGFFMDGWTNEATTLLEMAKRRWKELVVPLHEANGGDPEQWKNLNSLYSAVVKKIAPHLKREQSNSRTMVSFTCIICKGKFRKKLVSWMQLKSCLCKDETCQREYRRIKSAKNRPRFHREAFCENPDCRKRLIIPNTKGMHLKRFCSPECRMLIWDANNIDRKRELQKIAHAKRPKWKERYATLTDEQKEAYRVAHLDRIHKRRANETPEQKAARNVKRTAYARLYRERRRAAGNPITKRTEIVMVQAENETVQA